MFGFGLALLITLFYRHITTRYEENLAEQGKIIRDQSKRIVELSNWIKRNGLHEPACAGGDEGCICGLAVLTDDWMEIPTRKLDQYTSTRRDIEW